MRDYVIRAGLLDIDAFVAGLWPVVKLAGRGFSDNGKTVPTRGRDITAFYPAGNSRLESFWPASPPLALFLTPVQKGVYATTGLQATLYNQMKGLKVGQIILSSNRPPPYVVAMRLGYTITTTKVDGDGYVVKRIK